MIKDTLNKAFSLVKKGDVSEAFDIFERLLIEHPKSIIDILRKRSHSNAYLDNIDRALADRLEVISIDPNSVQDHFFAGVYSLELVKYEEAIDRFCSAIFYGGNDSKNTYMQESYLLRAYADLGLGMTKKALSDCDQVENDIEYFIEGEGVISKSRLVTYMSR